MFYEVYLGLKVNRLLLMMFIILHSLYMCIYIHSLYTHIDTYFLKYIHLHIYVFLDVPHRMHSMRGNHT